jgi:molybdopterin/thiamine biosynthesis adenylyltransferase
MDESPLYLTEDDRYERFRLIAWWDQEKLARAKILVVGAGALGNEALKNLALLGVGNIYVIDFDEIEASNLTRSVLFRRRDVGKSKAGAAVDALRDLNPEINVVGWRGNVLTDLGLGLFQEMDAVIGCLDNREARLWVNRCCWKVGTPWIDGGIQVIDGVIKVFKPGAGNPCYECGMTDADYRLINLRYSCPLLRREDILAGKVPTAPTISSMIAGLQVQEALKVVHGMQSEAGAAYVFNGVSNQFYKTIYPYKDDCLSHETYPAPIPVPLSADSTVDQLFAQVAELSRTQLPQDPAATFPTARLNLDRDLVVALSDPASGYRKEVYQPIQKVGVEAATIGGGVVARPELIHHVDAGTEVARRRLADVGIPPFDVVRVATPQGTWFLRLEADRERVLGGDPSSSSS